MKNFLNLNDIIKCGFAQKKATLLRTNKFKSWLLETKSLKHLDLVAYITIRLTISMLIKV